MTIEFSNATPAKTNTTISNLLLGISFIFLFAPITLIVLGYYKNLPTGSLVSPIPSGIVSQEIPNLTKNNNAIVAEPAQAQASTSSQTESNSQQKTATINENLSEVVISDPDVLEASQIYLTNKDEDKSLYSVKSKSPGQFTIVSNSISNQKRQVDYHIVNP